jgi:hypothetical protein
MRYIARAIPLISIRKTKGKTSIGLEVLKLMNCQPDVVKEFFKTKAHLFIVMDLNPSDQLKN